MGLVELNMSDDTHAIGCSRDVSGKEARVVKNPLDCKELRDDKVRNTD